MSKLRVTGKKSFLAILVMAMLFSLNVLPVAAAKNSATKNPPKEHFSQKKLKMTKAVKPLETKLQTTTSYPSWDGRVTLTFDDGNVDIYQNALPITKKYNLKAVLFPEIGALENNEAWSVSWKQLNDFKSANWEIGSHTMTHPDLTTVSDATLDYELSQSKKALVSHGFDVKTVAFPYGEANAHVLDYTTRYYQSSRLSWGDNGINIYPYNRYNLVAMKVSSTTTPEEVEKWMDDAVKNKKWLVLMFHDIVSGTPANEYQYNSQNLDKIASYIKSHSIKTPTITEALSFSTGTNLIKNYKFETLSNGWASNWLRSDSTNVKVEKSSVARIFSGGNHLKISGGSAEHTATTANITLPNSQANYLFSMFSEVNLTSAAGVSIWMDELDSNGKYISGKGLGGIFDSTYTVAGFKYKPTSTKVKKVAINIYSESGSNAVFYADNLYFGIVK